MRTHVSVKNEEVGRVVYVQLAYSLLPFSVAGFNLKIEHHREPVRLVELMVII